MHFKKLDLNLLVALDNMLEMRSVTHAAERMYMSQSAMSNALTRLRDYFGDPLLVQVGRKMELTPRAEQLQPLIRDILVRTEAAIETDPSFDPSASDRTFNILASDYSLRVLMPIVMQHAAEQNATVRFNFMAQTASPQSLLQQGDVDLLLAPEELISDEHPAELLVEEEVVVVAWKHGKYADIELTREVYENAGHVIMIPPQQARSIDILRLAKRGYSRNVEVTTYSFSTLPHLLKGTDRIATIHRHLLDRVGEHAELVDYPMPEERMFFHLMMQWHNYRDKDPGIAWLLDLFRGAANELNHS